MGFADKIKSFPLDRFKLGIHAAQGVINTIAWILSIAVIAKPGDQSSATYFYFFLTWITFLALVYNTVVQLWERTKRFSNPLASLVIDIVFTIFWIGAFASVQVWTSSGIPDSSKGYCSNFSYGDQDKCVISYGTVVLGVLIFLAWLAAAGISVFKYLQYRRDGPNRPSISNPKPIEAKFIYGDAASSRYSENSNAPSRPNLDLEKGGLHTSTADGTHPGRKLSWGQSPPNTAPVRPVSNYPEARPVFRTINYGQPATETSPLTADPTMHGPQQRRTAQSARYAPPRLQLYGPQDRSPALVMDYGAMSARTPLTPNFAAAPYNMRGGRLVRAPSTAYGDGNGFLNGYRSFYGGPTDGGAKPAVPPMPSNFDTLQSQNRTTINRMPVPGPASYRAGGYSSGFNTPLPTSMLTPQGAANSWRQDVNASYQAQIDAQATKGQYAL